MVYNIYPFAGITNQELFESINKNEIIFPQSTHISSDFKDLIFQLLEAEYKKG